jgi:hypothetical protein
MALQLILYSTSACHLCELAKDLLAPWSGAGVRLREVDISDDDELFSRYGVKIPVLRREDTGAELNWPFTALEVERLVAG